MDGNGSENDAENEKDDGEEWMDGLITVLNVYFSCIKGKIGVHYLGR